MPPPTGLLLQETPLWESRASLLLPPPPPSPAAWSRSGAERRSPCSFKFNVTVSERADDESPIIGSVYLPLNVSL